MDCATCNDTGQVWTPEQDGSGMYDQACPDCDAYDPDEAAGAPEHDPYNRLGN